MRMRKSINRRRFVRDSSADSPFLVRAGWHKTVDKMITVMGAPLPPEEASVIVDYLDRHYGR